jgi:hypothetical protein
MTGELVSELAGWLADWLVGWLVVGYLRHWKSYF